ncbi:MAG: PilT/PilU family type 4a pilus ATPase [bacterium]
MDFPRLLEAAVKIGASDIHLMEEYPPYLRVDGVLLPVKHPPVSHDEMLKFTDDLLPDRLKPVLEERRGADLGYQYKDLIRCRFIIYFERRKLRIVMRLITMNIPTIDDMQLPPVLKSIADYPRGMVLVTGPTGSGKSTTLASIIDFINTNQKVAIATIEDPIEYTHKNKQAVISQREVGDDVTDFNSGIVQAMRQDPDIILVGEMRDVETMRTAIKAAETGHLLFSTLHTTTAINTIERIIGTFPQSEHELLRDQLATNMKAILTQSLLRRAEGKGRIAAVEILIVNTTISKLIRDNRLPDIYGVMQGGQEGMQTFDLGLANLVRENKVTEEEAATYTRDLYAFRRFVKGATTSSDRGGIISGFS